MVRIEDILQLSIDERLDLVEKIWDSITVSDQPLPLTEAQRAELDRRLQAHVQNPDEVETWDEVKSKIQHRKLSR